MEIVYIVVGIIFVLFTLSKICRLEKRVKSLEKSVSFLIDGELEKTMGKLFNLLTEPKTTSKKKTSKK